MTFWIFIITICVIACIISIIYIKKSKFSNDALMLFSLLSGIMSFLITIIVVCCWMDYINFEHSFVIQKQTYEEIAASENPINDLYLTIDIIGANAELADYQASKNIYGPFTIVPDRVLDITPIGVD